MNLPRREIADGIFINCLATNKFKANSLTFNIELGLDEEKLTYANLAAKVLKRGCEKYPDIKSLNIKLDELYAADINTAVLRLGEAQYLCFFADFLVEKYTVGCDITKEIAELLGEVILNPLVFDEAFSEEYVAAEKKNLADDINSLINNKAAYAKFRCTEEMCPGEAYSLPPLGKVDILDGINGKKLYSFYKKILKENRMEVLYTGEPVYFDKLCASLSVLFKRLDRAYTPTENSCTVKKYAGIPREVVENMPVNQGKLSIGFRTGITNKSDDIAALIVANEVYGGFASSKLFMNVREKMSLCYYCSSGLDAVKGVMFVNAGIETENFEVAKNAILEQLNTVKSGDFTDEELLSAKNSLVNNYKSVSDSIGSLEAWYMSRIFRNEDDTPETRITQILEVTREEVKAVAEKISPEVIFFLRGTLGEDEADE